MTLDHIAVIGGGVAGVSAVRELRHRGFAGSVTLIDGERHPYDRPPLSKDFLLGKAGEEDLALAKSEWYQQASIEMRLGSRAVGIRPDGTVELADGTTVSADAVILTLGATARSFPGVQHPSVHVLRTMDDARRLKLRLRSGSRLAIVGGGLIGAEVASSASSLGVQVDLVDPVDPPLAPAFGDDIATALHSMHTAAGIEVHASGVEAIEPCEDTVVVRLSNGTRLTADDVLIGIGSEPVTDLAEAAGLEVDGGIIVDSRMRTSNPRIFAAGDAVRVRGDDGTLLRRKEHWEAAKFGGQAAAASVLEQDYAAAPADWFWSDRHGVHVEGVGSMTEPGTIVLRPYRDGAEKGAQMAFNISGTTLLGATAIDGGTAIRAARRLIEKNVAVSADDLADPTFDLKKLRRP